jgi:hypothetical protein
MNKVVSLGTAVISALAAATAGVAHADGGKHFGYGQGHGYYRPAYVAPAPVRPYYAPNRGYWHGGRWVAPVVIGAAIGGIALAVTAPSYSYAAPTYYAPSYYAPAGVTYAAPTVTYAAPAATGFDYADANGDGFVSYEEAAVYPHWQRNFGRIDRNRDGFLSSDEVVGWRLR